jgi:hypothetical protein
MIMIGLISVIFFSEKCPMVMPETTVNDCNIEDLSYEKDVQIKYVGVHIYCNYSSRGYLLAFKLLIMKKPTAFNHILWYKTMFCCQGCNKYTP